MSVSNLLFIIFSPSVSYKAISQQGLTADRQTNGLMDEQIMDIGDWGVNFVTASLCISQISGIISAIIPYLSSIMPINHLAYQPSSTTTSTIMPINHNANQPLAIMPLKNLATMPISHYTYHISWLSAIVIIIHQISKIFKLLSKLFSIICDF